MIQIFIDRTAIRSILEVRSTYAALTEFSSCADHLCHVSGFESLHQLQQRCSTITHSHSLMQRSCAVRVLISSDLHAHFMRSQPQCVTKPRLLHDPWRVTSLFACKSVYSFFIMIDIIAESRYNSLSDYILISEHADISCSDMPSSLLFYSEVISVKFIWNLIILSGQIHTHKSEYDKSKPCFNIY